MPEAPASLDHTKPIDWAALRASVE